MKLFDLTGKTAVITGSSKGIGRAIAGVALLLASDAGRFITGQTIVVDGGLTSAGAG